MHIYKDKFTDDELFTDTYPMEEINGVVYKVKGKMTSENLDFDDAKIGANASADGCEDGIGADPSSVSGVDIIIRSRLNEFPLDKKGYMAHIKEYMKKVKTRLEEEESKEVEIFQANVAKFVKSVIGEFKEYQLYCGESFKPDGMLCLLKWESIDGGGETPYVYFFKHGLLQEKV